MNRVQIETNEGDPALQTISLFASSIAVVVTVVAAAVADAVAGAALIVRTSARQMGQ